MAIVNAVTRVCCLFLCCMSALFAETNAYLGVNAYASQWQMGFASGKPINFAGSQYATNRATPLIFMAGMSFSLVHNKIWAVTYQAEIGTASAAINYSSAEVSAEFKATPSILRTDHSLALTRALGASGFSLYAGAKLQYYGYREPGGSFTNTGMSQQATYNENKRLMNFGPALGLTYMFRVALRSYIALQAGWIYFFGKYDDDISLVFLGNSVGASQAEKYQGLGGSALVSFVSPLTDRLLLQIALRGQYYITRSTEAQLTNITATGKRQVTDISGSALMDNVQDLLLGAQIAAIYRLF